jgi:hypothetical protein
LLSGVATFWIIFPISISDPFPSDIYSVVFAL